MKKYLSIILVLLLIIAFGGCGNSTTNDSGDTSSNVEENKTDDADEQSIYDEYVASSVETTLFSGNWTVGKDIPKGKYIITTSSGSGNFFIYDPDGAPLTNEILCVAGDEEDSMGVSKISTYLNEGDAIEISGLNEVLFSPGSAELSNDLSAGRYHVGHDIKSGDYIVTTNLGSGNFFVYDEDGYPLTNEILCVAGDEEDSMGVSKLKVTLKDGYVIDISGLNNVHFE